MGPTPFERSFFLVSETLMVFKVSIKDSWVIIRRRADANHSSHRLNQGLNECSYVQKRLGNMPDHCTLEYKLAVDFSCQQISGSGGRYYFSLIFAHFFFKKTF